MHVEHDPGEHLHHHTIVVVTIIVVVSSIIVRVMVTITNTTSSHDAREHLHHTAGMYRHVLGRRHTKVTATYTQISAVLWRSCRAVEVQTSCQMRKCPRTLRHP